MTYRFPLLRDADYMGYVGPIHARGWNPSTHLAEVRYPIQRAPVVSVVKLLPPDGLAACNEAISWLFLRAAGIQAPGHAGIMVLSQAKLKKACNLKAPDGYAQDGMVLAWASQQLAFQSIQALFAGTDRDERWLKVVCTLQGAALAAFDETFLNCDRNHGNILYLGPDSCAAIDHEAIFAHHRWLDTDIPHLSLHSDTYRRLVAGQKSGKIRLQDLETTLNRMVAHAEKHAAALAVCKSSIQQLLSDVYPEKHSEMTSRVLSFIAARTAQNWMNTRLGVV
ncbi:hypothetical protein KBW71_02180 [Hydrogenophaga aromaticivorans]|uniref:hypothetical protein n=1 Tax=Hydrogenophaga aromaticivorans TaxID=2610898 RepID=UPI001B3990F2|nr:hypothetical protein [Hydrogenophaga aromaticivorans]MBQ0917239.1 hypothetical protein [Hydrogenophaga aromaticivorans]